MTEIVNLLHEAINENDDYAPLLWRALEDHQQLIQHGNTESNHSMIAKINSLLNNQASRDQAFTLLLKYLPECDLDVLNERGLVWLNTTIKTCAQKNLSDSTARGFDVIRLLIERSIDAPEFMKQISHSVIQKIFEAAYDPCESAECNAVNCLIQCMLSYPGPCGPSKNIVEKIALKYIDSSDVELVRGAAISLLLMQQTRSGGEAKVMHKKYFTEYHVQIIGSLHHYFNVIFENVEENYDVDADSDEIKLKLPELCVSHEPVIKVAQLSQRIINLLIFLKEALNGPYSVEKVIRPNQILGIIKRGLDVNAKSIAKNAIVDNLVLASIIPQIHVHLFDVLDAFVELLQGNVRLFCKDIISIYESSLKWTSTGGKQFGCKKPYSNVRKSTYNSLKQYCLLLGKGSLVEIIAKIAVENIVEDTLPFKSEVILQSSMSNNRGGSLSKRAKKKLQKVQNEATNLAQTHSSKQNSHVDRVYTDAYNTELCVSALDALSAFVLACGHEIKPTLQRSLQQHIVQLCLEIDINVLEKSQLYFSDSCRKALYEALTSLIMYPHHLAPPPLQYAVRILTNACLLDPSKDVREKSRLLMAGVEKIMNPQRTMPYFKVSEEELNNAIKELRSGKGTENDFSEDQDETLDAVINLEDDEQVPDKPTGLPVITIDSAPEETGEKNETEVIDVDMMEAQDESCMIVEDEITQTVDVQGVPVTTQDDLIRPVGDTTEPDQILCKKISIPKQSSNDLPIPPEKRIKLDEEDLVVDELAETFVDE